MVVATLILGLALGAVGTWLVTRAGAARLEAELRLERERTEERGALLQHAREELGATFKALSSDVLRSSNESFLQLAQTQLAQAQQQASGDLEQRQKAVEALVAPIKESLQRVDGQVQTLEQARKQAYGSLLAQVQQLAQGQDTLRRETSNLVTALRAPHARGRWGEMQLKRVVEMAGMIAHCDFVEQSHTTDGDGRSLRPDLIVKLPGGKNVVVDAKAPLVAYLDGIEAQDDELRILKLRDHARQVRDHISKLSAKAYWRQFSPTPDFVVMFVPDEAFLRAAVEQDPGLMEMAMESNVILASPTTLITLLRVIAYGWQQETVAENARTISQLGCELYERLGTLARHVAKLGRSLDGAVGAYNEAVGSLETRVLVSARRFEEHGITGADVPELQPLERQARPLQAVELAPPASDANAA